MSVVSIVSMMTNKLLKRDIHISEEMPIGYLLSFSFNRGIMILRRALRRGYNR